MTWSRRTAAAALLHTFQTAAGSGPVTTSTSAALNVATVTVFEQAPATLSPPSLVIGRPVEVRYAVGALGIDEAEFPLVCVGPIDDDTVDDLIVFVRSTLLADPSLGHQVQSATATSERSWRMLRVGGIDLLAADVILQILM